jgi:hypothetical protein
MKINRLETHDRLQHFVKDQALNINQGATDCLKTNPLSLALQERSPYIYIFAHPRTVEDGVTKKMYWQPRLTKPEAQTNSYLFRAQSKSDALEVCWLLPPSETWDQYKRGNVTEHELVCWSIDQFINNRQHLQAKEADDLPEAASQKIYKAVIAELRQDRDRKSLRTNLLDDLYLG